MGDEQREQGDDMLSGIIEALEHIGIGWHADDRVIESGVRIASMEPVGSETWALTALKLLARARRAEAEVHALTAARHDDATAHSQELANLAANVEQYKKMLADAHSRVAPTRIVLPASTGTELIEALRSMTDAPLVEGAELVFSPATTAIDPTVAALAVIDDFETNGDLGPCAPLPMPPVNDGTPDAKDRLRIHAARLEGRAAQVERLARVIGSVARGKPDAPTFPLWCAMRPADSDLPFRGPCKTEAEAVSAAAEILAEDEQAAVVRRCRRIQASEIVTELELADFAESLESDPPPGERVYVIGGFEVPWVRVRKGADLRLLDALLEVDAYAVEPEGATP